MVPRKLGQHFLRPASVERLVHVIAPRRDQHFLEIGPGAGALTLELAPHVASLTAVELDAGLAARLEPRLPANVRLVRGDALAIDLRPLTVPGVRLVGNLPYYISSPLLRRFLDLRDVVMDVHVMLQDEVASRIASPPGHKAYGILSVLWGLWADLDIPLRFPPGAFEPPPKVDSAVLRARLLPAPREPLADTAGFEKFVQLAFHQRRRTLENNLQDSYPHLKHYLRLLNIEGSRRAETLSVVEFARLFSALGPRD